MKEIGRDGRSVRCKEANRVNEILEFEQNLFPNLWNVETSRMYGFPIIYMIEIDFMKSHIFA